MASGESAGKGNEPLLVALGEVLEAMAAVRAALQESEQRTLANMARLRAGEPLAEVVHQAPVSTARVSLNEAVDRLTRARQASRAATFRQLIEEGTTRKEIAAKWGFSLQVVSRIVNFEPRSPEAGGS
jgi:DNA invertase Pin-like site-specific DNA recombinase